MASSSSSSSFSSLLVSSSSGGLLLRCNVALSHGQGTASVGKAFFRNSQDAFWSSKFHLDYEKGYANYTKRQRFLRIHSLRAEKNLDTKILDNERLSIHAKQSSENSDGKAVSENAKKREASSTDVLLPKLDTVVIETAEIIAETAEVTAKTVSSVGEIDGSLAIEQRTLDQGVAVRTVTFWVCTAIAFGLGVGLKEGSDKASEFFTGYFLEQSLSVDNLFVFVLIFKYFQVPISYQSRVLTYGIAGAVVFRAAVILLGVATLQRFEFVNLIFAGLLLFSAYKLFTEGEDEEEDLADSFIVKTCSRFIPVSGTYDEDKFFTTVNGLQKATPLLLALVVVELSDIVFAVDSIPAVFGVTRDPFIVFSSNMFAILGLRSLFTLISAGINDLQYLQPTIALILGFIGSKMIADFSGFHIQTEISLGIVLSLLGSGVGLSLLTKKEDGEQE